MTARPPKDGATPTALGLAELAGVGFMLVGNVVVGLVLGFLAAKYLHWPLALPIFLVLGFASGFVAMYRRLTR